MMEPQEVFGAATPCGRPCTEIKSEHDPGCWSRQDPGKRKKSKKPLRGAVCLL